MKTSQKGRKTIHTALSAKDTGAFRRLVWKHYRKYGRVLPWRGERDPYRILVSEVMLQQTQVDRVIPKYHTFLKKFPTVRTLAKSPLREVLREWSGLGYNRRAKMLHECAKKVVSKYKGHIPYEIHELETLPGIGPYTAAAVYTFAHNKPAPLIETNIRAVFIHHFFSEHKLVTDRELMPLIEQTLDRKQSALWFHALMDYGSMLKRTKGNASQKSAHYVKQSRFEGSPRQLRGAIIRALLNEPLLTLQAIAKQTNRDTKDVYEQLTCLVSEGILEKRGRTFALSA